MATHLNHEIYDGHGQYDDQEYWRCYGYHYDGAEDSEECHEEGADGARDGLVDDIDVLGEPVEDAPQGGGVEEDHRRAQDVVQHFVVEGPGGKEARDGNGEG